MSRLFVVVTLLMVTFLPYHAGGKTLTARQLRNYINDPKVVDLIQAANKGDVEKVNALIEQGADVNYIGKYGFNPLFFQMGSLNLKGFKCLLEHGANPNARMRAGSDMWLLASGGDHPDEALTMLKLCLEHGGDPNWTVDSDESDNGETLLMAAFLYNEKNAYEVTKLLVEAGANVNVQDPNNGYTALTYAASCQQYHAAWYLLQHGADFTQKDYFYYNLKYSRVISYKDEKDLEEKFKWRQKIVEFLREKGIKIHLKFPKLEDGKVIYRASP